MSEGQRPTRPIHTERREYKEQEPTPVVRLFLLQSVEPSQIEDSTKPENIEFTQMLLVKKNGDPEKPVQLVPIGGEIDSDESVTHAALREGIERTHLRPTQISFRELHAKYQYTEGVGEERKSIQVSHAIGRLLPQPLDKPYALNPEEHSIEGFEYVTLSEFETMHVADEMHPDVAVDSPGIQTAVEEVRAEFTLVECAKKTRVLIELMDVLSNERITPEERSEVKEYGQFVLEQLNKLYTADATNHSIAKQIGEYTQSVNRYYGNVVHQLHLTTADIKKGLRLSNITASIEHAVQVFNPETGEGLPSLSLIFPLLFSPEHGSIDRSTMRVAMENPHIHELLTLSNALYDFASVHNEGDEKKRRRIEGRIRRRLHMEDNADINAETVLKALYKAAMRDFGNTHSFQEVTHEIDEYFSTLSKEAKIRADVHIEQLPEINGDDFLDIAQYAMRVKSNPEYSQEDQERLCWEAQRKLILSLLLNMVWTAGDDIIARGVEPIMRTQEQFFSPQQAHQFTMYYENAAGESSPQTVQLYERQKTLMSFFRKVIVRDILPQEHQMKDLVKDVFAQAVVFDNPNTAYSAEDMEMVECDFGRRVFDENNQPLETVKAPRLLAQLMQNYLRNPNITLVEYKGLPKEGKMKSKGPGGGGKIRMAKFYVRYEDSKAKEDPRYVETQVFLPKMKEDGSWRSGMRDYEHKKKDDIQYAIQRLFFPMFESGRLRSFMELMYPGEKYSGSLRTLFEGHVSKRQINKIMKDNSDIM